MLRCKEVCHEASNKRIALASALSAAFVFSLTGSTFAAQTAGSPGGIVTDRSNAASLLQIQQQGDVSYVSGGVGQDESAALERMRSH